MHNLGIPAKLNGTEGSVLGANKDFYTWNPAIHFDIVNNPALSEEFQRRTLTFRYIDNDRRYDEIEWELDNRDGLLTKPEFLALGFFVRLRLGYTGTTTGWKAFIISRVRGGVGNANEPTGMATVGVPESIIRMSGRNRNAPDLKRRGNRHGTSGRIRGTRRRHSGGQSDDIRPTGTGTNSRSGRRAGLPTADVTYIENAFRRDPLYEDVLDTKRRRSFNVPQTSDAVREILRNLGHPDSALVIEDSGDKSTSYTIPEGIPAGDWIQSKANELGWVYKVHKGFVHFHSPNWHGNKQDVVETFRFGTPDVLQLTIDADFRLPIPGKVRAQGYDPVYHRTVHEEETVQGNQATSKVYQQFYHDPSNYLGLNDADRKATLLQDIAYLVPGAALQTAGPSARRHFRDKHLRSMLLKLQITGNPKILATDYVRIAATGNPLVDGVWYVEQAIHDFDGSGSYVTTLNLRSKGKTKASGTPRYARTRQVEGNAAGMPATYNQYYNLKLDSKAGAPIAADIAKALRESTAP